MHKDNKRKRAYLKSIKTIQEYNDYISDIILTDEQQEIMKMVFIRGLTYRQIGDELNYSEQTIKNKVRKILDKL